MRLSSRRSRLASAIAVTVCTVCVAGVAGPLTGSAAAATACGTPTTPNGHYVQYVYGEILDRCAEPAAQRAWTTLLDKGTSRLTFAEALDNSRENLVVDNVVPIYAEVLHRKPTPAELRYWAREIKRDRQDATLLSTLTASTAFYTAAPKLTTGCIDEEHPKAHHKAVTHGTSRDGVWVDWAFCTSLDRMPTVAERSRVVATLRARPGVAARYTAVMALKHSTENAVDWVEAVYGAALNRAPESKHALSTWVAYLKGRGGWRTFDLWTRFLASKEAFGLAQQPPPQSGSGGQ